MHIDEIDGKWSETVYVWVRPADGDWQAITNAMNQWDRDKTDWRPAMISGFSDDKWAYNTHNDTRQVRLIGSQYTYPNAKFEIGGLLEHDLDNPLTPASAPLP
jgi:hypothetical protein|nr:hypothetical protein [Neorhizobium tomejilense]